jgi:hypothetical protein
MPQNRLKLHLWSLLVSIWLVSACMAPEDQRPDDLIDEDRMADILSEIHIAEARVSRLSLRSIDSSNIVYKRLENQIFRKFKVDTATYRKSYVFYSSHPVDMEAVYKKVTEKLTNKPNPKKASRL